MYGVFLPLLYFITFAKVWLNPVYACKKYPKAISPVSCAKASTRLCLCFFDKSVVKVNFPLYPAKFLFCPYPKRSLWSFHFCISSHCRSLLLQKQHWNHESLIECFDLATKIQWCRCRDPKMSRYKSSKSSIPKCFTPKYFDSPMFQLQKCSTPKTPKSVTPIVQDISSPHCLNQKCLNLENVLLQNVPP